MEKDKILVAQIPMLTGAVEENSLYIQKIIKEADRSDMELVVFPEMTITGYPLEDLADNPDLRKQSMKAIKKIAELYDKGILKTPAIVGSLYMTDDLHGGEVPVNAAIVFQPNAEPKIFPKNILPNEGVFDEERNFKAAYETHAHDKEASPIIDINGSKVGVMICADMWEPAQWPFNSFILGTADIIVIINGSTYEIGKQLERISAANTLSEQSQADVLYVNRVGGQDEVVFDGQSFYVTYSSRKVKVFPAFQTTVGSVDSMSSYTPVGDNKDLMYEEVWNALVLGLRNYAEECGFKKVVLGVSGGIDSAIVGALAADAVGGENIIAISMPSPFSSVGSLTDAKELADRHNMEYQVKPITDMMKAFHESIYDLEGVPAENLQSRLRGIILMAASNSRGALTLACGNKPELAVGYSTIYGDSVGGYAPIKDIPKTLVWELARWRNRNAVAKGDTNVIPSSSIDKPASAELAPGQEDEKDLPAYPLLDRILKMYVDDNLPYWEIVELTKDKEVVDRVIKLVKNAEWKRRQYPIGTNVNHHSFGKDRRIPIMSSFANSK